MGRFISNGGPTEFDNFKVDPDCVDSLDNMNEAKRNLSDSLDNLYRNLQRLNYMYHGDERYIISDAMSKVSQIKSEAINDINNSIIDLKKRYYRAQDSISKTKRDLEMLGEED